MELDPTEWQLVSDPFEDWLRIFRSTITPFIEEPQVGSVTLHLLIAVKTPSNPPVLLACHTILRPSASSRPK
jgi:hypothetical protein